MKPPCILTTNFNQGKPMSRRNRRKPFYRLPSDPTESRVTRRATIIAVIITLGLLAFGDLIFFTIKLLIK
jgi:hypothetical protein